MDQDSFIALLRRERQEMWNCLFLLLLVLGGLALYYYFALDQDVQSLSRRLSRIEKETVRQELPQPKAGHSSSSEEKTPPPPPHLLPGMRFRGL